MKAIDEIINDQNLNVTLNPDGVVAKDTRLEKFQEAVAQEKNKDNTFYQNLIHDILKVMEKIEEQMIKGPDFTGTITDSRGFPLPSYLDLYRNQHQILMQQDSKKFQDFLQYGYELNNSLEQENISVSLKQKIDNASIQLRRINYYFNRANINLSNALFAYIGKLIQENPDITLSYDTLRVLLDTQPAPFYDSIENLYYSKRQYNFQSLAEILKQNNTLKKSGLSTEDTYQLLIDTHQIHKPEMWLALLTPEEVQSSSHQVLDDFLNGCDISTFITINDFFAKLFDPSYDPYTKLIKRIQKNPEMATTILERLCRKASTEQDYNFIADVLTNKNITIDYNKQFRDYINDTGYTITSSLALTRNPKILSILMQDSNKKYCFYGYSDVTFITSYEIDAILGDYENSIQKFRTQYRDMQNYSAYVDNPEEKLKKQESFEIPPYATDILVQYMDTLTESFKKRQIPEEMQKNILIRIFESDCIGYMNLKEVLEKLQESQTQENMEAIITILQRRNQQGQIHFIQKIIHWEQIISVMNDQEIQDVFTKMQPSKTYTYQKRKKITE